MTNWRELEDEGYVPDRTCIGCGRTVRADDMLCGYCPQCQEDGTMPEEPDPDDLPEEPTEPNPFEQARRRMQAATLAQLVAVLKAVSRGEDVGVYRDAARPFAGMLDR